jgi:GAF domain-containing protein
MNRSLFRIFAPPVFPDDEDKTRTAAILNTILLGVIALLGLVLAIQGSIGAKTFLSMTTAVLAIIVAVSIGLLFMLRRGHVKGAGFVLVTLGWFLLTLQAWTYSGLRDVAFVGYIIVILIAALLIGVRTSFGYALISVAMGWVFAYLEIQGKYNGLGDSPYPTAITMTIIFLLASLVSFLAINNLNISLKKARQNADALKVSNLELQNLQAGLEKRVAERTVELSAALELNQKRASQLQTIAEVAHQVSMVQELGELLPTITRLISERFGYYHVGIFLIDEKREYAVLKAANSAGGKRMLERGHRLQIGQTGIVGFVTSMGRPRVARNVGVDAIHFNNPNLPTTKAEMALPLLVGKQVIGALDIQSESDTAFESETLDAMRTLADQVAIAIETARLIGETRKALAQSQEVYRQYIRQEWSRLARENREIGYQRGPDGIRPLLGRVNRIEVQRALETGSISTEQGETSALAIPIKLRDEVIGVLDINAQNPSRRWTSEDMALLQAVADRIALAMENARLLQDAQRRASKERTIGEITNKFSASVNLKNILETAVEELGRALPGTEIVVQFESAK